MEISENRLREWVDPAIDSDTQVSQLTMAGLEVGGVRRAAPKLVDIVVAEVTSVEKHPNADKLSLCRVNDGSAEHAVVCGATNVRAGLKVAFARVAGATGFTRTTASLTNVAAATGEAGLTRVAGATILTGGAAVSARACTAFAAVVSAFAARCNASIRIAAAAVRADVAFAAGLARATAGAANAAATTTATGADGAIATLALAAAFT